MIEISSTAMVEALDSVLLSKLTPMLVGSPGIGKSDIVKLVAKKHNLKVIDDSARTVLGKYKNSKIQNSIGGVILVITIFLGLKSILKVFEIL